MDLTPALSPKPARWPRRVLVTAMVFFVLFFGASNWFRQVNLYTSQYDMGNMDQVLWQSLHGRWFQMTNPAEPQHVLRTAWHADYLLLAYLPAYAVWPDPRIMLLLQVLAVASGAVPLFWLARKKLGERLGVVVPILYLLFPTLEWATIFDVHAVVLVAPLLLWAWWAMTEKRWWLYGLFTGLALLGKEDVGVVVAAMGVYWVWRRGYRRAALASIVLGLGWTMFMLGWAIPQARNAPGHFALGYYQSFGGTYTEILRNLFLHPGTVIRTMLNTDSLSLLRGLLIPVGLLSIFGLPVLLVAIPELAVNLLSASVNQHTIFFQYMSAIVPFIFLALIDGIRRFRIMVVKLNGRWPMLRLSLFATVGVPVLAGLGIWSWSPLPGLVYGGNALSVFQPSPYRPDVVRVRALLKPSDKVVATNNLVPQFSRRDYIWSFPNVLDQADAIVVLEGGDYETQPKAEISKTVRALRQDPRFTLVIHDKLFWFFQKAPGESS